MFISISGMIGAGKSTLATALAKKLNLPVYYEPVIDNVYLEDFYKDMKKYSFPLQVYLLNRRFAQQLQQIVWSGKGGIQIGRSTRTRSLHACSATLEIWMSATIRRTRISLTT